MNIKVLNLKRSRDRSLQQKERKQGAVASYSETTQLTRYFKNLNLYFGSFLHSPKLRWRNVKSKSFSQDACLFYKPCWYTVYAKLSLHKNYLYILTRHRFSIRMVPLMNIPNQS